MSYTSYEANYPSGAQDNEYINISEDILNQLEADLAAARDEVNASYINTSGVDAFNNPTGFFIDRTDVNNKHIYYDFKPDFQKVPMNAITVYNAYDDGSTFVTQMTLQHPDYASNPSNYPEYCIVNDFAGYYSFTIDTA